MKKLFATLGIINWKTTIAGVSTLIATLGLILNAWRTKDFGAIFSQSQTLIPIVTGILMGLGLLAAKDSTVTGVGTQAATLNDQGKLVTVDNKVVGQQPPA